MSKKILANDGISQAGIEALEKANYQVLTNPIEQDALIDFINSTSISGLLVRSATQVRQDLIDACPNLKWVGVFATGYNVVDFEYAASKGVLVANVPGYSTDPMQTKVFISDSVGVGNGLANGGDFILLISPDGAYDSYMSYEGKYNIAGHQRPGRS